MGSGVRLKARWRLARGAVRIFVWLIVAILTTAVVLLTTGLGHRTVLGWGLDQARARVAGDIEVDGIRSANLLQGARLLGVRLLTPDGEPFLLADSVEVGYQIGGLLRGEIVLGDVRMWRPRLLISRGPDQDAGTLRRWLGPSAGDGEGGGLAIELRDIRIDDGSVTVVSPVDEAAREGVFRVEERGGGLVRRIELDEIEARIPELGVGGESGGFRAEVSALALVARVLEQPLVLGDVSGSARLRGDTLAFTIDRGRLGDIDTEGQVEVILGDSHGVGLGVELDIEDADLADYRWLAESLPPLTGDARVTGRLAPDHHAWTVSELDGRFAGGRVQGGGTVRLDGTPRLTETSFQITSVPLDALDPYLSEPLPIDGALTGRLSLSGPLRALETSGRMSLVGPDRLPTVAQFEGGVRTGEGLGVQDFTVTLDPLDWDLLAAFAPASPLDGPGRARVNATGSLDGGLRFSADLEHRPAGLRGSHVRADGGVRRMGDSITVDVQADLAPLSLEALRDAYPRLPIGGVVTGSVRARGFLRDLTIVAQVGTELGRLDLTGRADLRDPGARYALEGQFADFLASELVPALPDSSRVSGRIEVEGSGRDPATLTATGRLELDESRFGGIHVDSLRLVAGVRSGVLTLDTLAGMAAGFRVGGSGTLAVDTVQPSGTIDLRFETESLLGIRPLFMGEGIIAADTLGTLERELLRLDGIDPDTLPVQSEVAMDGRVSGRATLTGSLADFALEGSATLEDGVYGTSTLADAHVTVTAEGLPGLAGEVHVEVDAGAARIFERSYVSGSVALDYTRPRGSTEIVLRRSDDEDYRVRATFELDSLGGAIELHEFGLRFDTVTYSLRQTATLAWSDSALVVRDVELTRPGPEPLSIRADGTLPRRGSADFDLAADGVQLELLVRLLQREEALDLTGVVDLDVRVEGTAARPTIRGTFSGEDVRAGAVELTRVEGEIDYADRRAAVTLDAWRNELHVLEVGGTVPVDLAFRSVPDRTPAEPLDLAIRTDSLPATFVLAIIEDLENVAGTLSGQVDLRGTVEEPVFEGTIQLTDGAWTVGALGVRQSDVQATFEVQADDRVLVSATGRSGGTVAVDGVVTLSPLTDPGLDLTVRLDRFRGIDRRDMNGILSGEVRITQSYARPAIQGALRVDEGILFLEEFQRQIGIVDLSDPRFFAYMDSALVQGRPLLGETRNPFMENLRVGVDLEVERNTWLRSSGMNVEIGGQLIVTYDRPNQDFAMIGELEAIRGTYTLPGISRTFDVRSGTVEFVGTPGINPNLDIEAVARVRRREADPLMIVANVTGTLIEPRVRLSSDEGGISQSDLLSYIAIGRPSTEVTGFLQGGRGDAFLSGGLSIVGSTLASSLASLAQGAGFFDYLSISQAAEASVQGARSTFSSTQVEVGRYFFGGDYFAALTLRPLSGNSASNSLIGGFRVEWQASDRFHVEAFAEDRFLRGGGYGFQALGIRSSLIYGLSLVREWGY